MTAGCASPTWLGLGLGLANPNLTLTLTLTRLRLSDVTLELMQLKQAGQAGPPQPSSPQKLTLAGKGSKLTLQRVPSSP